MSLNLPKIHALTGCHTTSYFCRVGKTKVFKKLISQQDLCFLLSELRNYSQITNSVIEETKEFIRTVLYNGNKNESYINARVKLYKGLWLKSSLTLPPDPDSFKRLTIKTIKRQTIKTNYYKS